jgi:hypothetical protein
VLDDERPFRITGDLELLDLFLVQFVEAQEKGGAFVALESVELCVELVCDPVAAGFGEFEPVAAVDVFGGVVVEAELFVSVAPAVDGLGVDAGCLFDLAEGLALAEECEDFGAFLGWVFDTGGHGLLRVEPLELCDAGQVGAFRSAVVAAGEVAAVHAPPLPSQTVAAVAHPRGGCGLLPFTSRPRPTTHTNRKRHAAALRLRDRILSRSIAVGPSGLTRVWMARLSMSA